MVSELAAMDDQMLWGRMWLSFLEMASSTFVTPWPILSLTMYFTSSIDSSMPTPGSTIYSHQ